MDRPGLAIAALLALGGCLALDDEPAPAPLVGLEPAPCALVERTLRIERLELPHNARQAEALGFDLDGDPEGRVDNTGGLLLALLELHHGDALDDRIARDLQDVPWLLVVQTCDDDTHARVTLTGAGGVRGAPAVGERQGDRVVATGGTGVIPLGLLFDRAGDSAAAHWAGALALSADLVLDADGSACGRLGLAIEPAAIARAASDALAIELALPDLDLVALYRGREVYWPDYDQRRDSVSLGLGVRAIAP